MNGIYLSIEKTPIHEIGKLEKTILEQFKVQKHPIQSMSKYMLRFPNKTLLKISGIWETDSMYGIAYKLIDETNDENPSVL